MEIAFLKLQASGNDYICIETGKTPPPEERYLMTIARRMCDRNRGVGAQGIIILGIEDEKKIRARIVNQQGDDERHCGAALQCAARYAYDSGLVTERYFQIDAGGKNTAIEIIDSSNVRLDMGVPYAHDQSSELKELSDKNYTRAVVVDNHELSYTPLFLTAPHAVFFGVSTADSLPHLAKKMETTTDFSEKTRISFVRVFSREELNIRSWLRGGGEPFACPETAAAGLVAAALNGFTEREALVHLRGGDLFCEWEEPTNRVFATGPSEYVFSGNYYFDENEKS